jgi:hypothetical protein
MQNYALGSGQYIRLFRCVRPESIKDKAEKLQWSKDVEKIIGRGTKQILKVTYSDIFDKTNTFEDPTFP